MEDSCFAKFNMLTSLLGKIKRYEREMKFLE
jgi:hypothetical protein